MSAEAVTRYIEDLESRGGLEEKDIGAITNTSTATVSRWRTGTINPEPKNELILAALANVVNRLTDFYANFEIRAWLHARHPQLDGERVIDLIRCRRTLEALTVINRLGREVFL